MTRASEAKRWEGARLRAVLLRYSEDQCSAAEELAKLESVVAATERNLKALRVRWAGLVGE